MTHRLQTICWSALVRAGRPCARALAVTALAAAGAGCDTAQDPGGTPAASGDGATQQQPSAAAQQQNGAGQADQDQSVQTVAVQTESGGSADAPRGDVSQQAAGNVESTIELGAFSPTTPPSAQDTQGRLPAEGDRAIYVPDTALFPGAARLDPGIENPVSGDAEAIAAGERHFNAFNCSGCHAPLGGGGMGPPLSDDQWIHGNEPAQLYLTIMHGRPEGMPAWGSMLPRQAVWELVAYIETLNEIDNYATELGFDATHATSVRLPGRFGEAESTNETRTGQ